MPDPAEFNAAPAWVLADLKDRALRAGTATQLARPQSYSRLDGELRAVRAELLRVDTKANSLLALAGVLLGASVAVLVSSRNLPAAAAAVAWVAVGAVIAAVVLLAHAMRPNLSGDFGFVRWARMAGGRQLLDDLAATDRTGDPLLTRADELRWLARALLDKYVAVRHAVHLLVAGLTLAAIAAAVAMWLR